MFLEDIHINNSKRAKFELLSKIYEILNKYNIKVFLTCGTLLGAMREGDFIAWDTDIDLGCFNIEEVFALKEVFNKEGLNVHIKNRSSRFAAKELVIEFIKNPFLVNGMPLHCDIFQFNLENERVIFRYNIQTPFQKAIVFTLSRIVTLKQGDGAHKHIISVFKPSEEVSSLRKVIELLNVAMCKHGIHKFEYFRLKKFKFLGIPVYIPQSYDKHLTLLYGSNWRIPNPQYKNSKERQVNIRRVSL